MAVSTTDKNRLSSDQQSAVQNYTDQYYAAKARGDTQGMQAAHAAAEKVRNQAGYSGGANGDGNTSVRPSQTAQQVQSYLDQYRDTNANRTYEFGGTQYWSNNYDAQDNLRSQANAIRQQMLENSQNWHKAGSKEDKDYLHQQNLALNNLLNQYAGGVESQYDPKTGKWYTENADLGYGDIANYDRANAKRLYGLTDQQIDDYIKNTNRYYTLRQQNPTTYQNSDYANNGIIQGNAFSQGATPGNGVGNGGAGMAGYGSGSYSYSPGQVGDANGGSFSRNSDLSGYLDAWRQAANKQATNQIDYAVNKGVNDLQRAEEDAKVQFQTQRNQVDADEARNLDNAALYAELRGDRGGIGQQQYSSVQNNAAQNRQTVNSAQVKLATDTQRQIADLRAQGEFQKADKLLEISQSYLQQLVSLEQWAAEYDLSAAQFNESVRQWEKEYQLSVANLMGTYNGQQTLSARNAQASDLASAGKALLSAGILPSSEQAEAMGYTIPQLQLMLAQNQAGQSAGASGGGGGSTTGGAQSSSGGAEWGRGIGQLAMENTKKLISRHLGNGNASRAEEVMNAVSPNMSREEYNEIVKIYKNNGYPMEYAGR
nr:MAG TPA: hypothetical protein [Caudoviricetes sp.]